MANTVKEHTERVPKVGKYATMVNKDSTVMYGFESTSSVKEYGRDSRHEVSAVGGTLTPCMTANLPVVD